MEYSLNQIIESINEYLDIENYFNIETVDEFAGEFNEVVEDFDYYF